MRFFLDTANLEELKTGARWGILDRVATNPTLIAKEGVAMDEQIRGIRATVDGDLSAVVIAKNVVVRAPLTRDGIQACSR
jgi:transaldolase